MRSFQRFALAGAVTALSLGALSNPLTSRFAPGPIILGGGSGRELTPKPPRVNGKRPSLATDRARRVGERDDPGFGIASKGRTGARARMLAMEAGRKRRTPGTSNPFTKEGRVLAFSRYLNAGLTRNEAAKLARRVSA